MPDSVDPTDWYKKVAEQIGSAVTLLPVYPLQTLVHPQQAAEMLLKGKLLETGQNPGRIHSIEYLQKELIAIGTAFTPLSDPALLDAGYFDARYPASGYSPPNTAEIASALEEVKILASHLAPVYFPAPPAP